MNQNNPVAVVTGASQGIGLELVKQLAERDFQVILTARSAESVEKGLAALPQLETVTGRVLDVSEDASVAAFFDWLDNEYGRLDVLINNAGRIYGYDYGIDTASELILEAINNNALSAWRTGALALPLMNQQGYGRVVNVSSGMGAMTDMGTGAIPYRLSKTTMNGVTAALAAEAAPNVKVNAICPGWVRTAMGGDNASRHVSEGAASALWAALLPEDGPSGGFFRDGKPLDW